MGELSDTLDEFQEVSRSYYGKVMEILKEKYCWKCPMRTTSSETLCREVESWIRLTETVEAGIQQELLSENISLQNLEVIAAKFLEKNMKSPTKKMNPRSKSKDMLVIKLERDQKPFAVSGDFLFVETNIKRIKAGDLVLLPRACPLATYWYVRTAKMATVPFKIFKVAERFQKKGCKYIRTENGLEIPLEFLIGVVKEIVDHEDLSLKTG